jgi:hypothetical protein
MNEQKETPPSNGLTKFEVVSLAITAVGFVGLGGLALLRWAFGVSERQLMASSTGAIAVGVFSGLLMFGLIILFPLATFARRRTIPPQPVRPMPWWGIFLIPLGLGDPDWTMPRWIVWPVMAVLAFLLFFVFVIVIAAFFNA